MQHSRNSMQIISGILLFILGGALLFYTANRTLSFIEMSLPADKQLLGYLALAAFDGGLIVWTLLYMWNAASHIQRGIALGMIAVSIVGVCIGFIADTLVQSGRNGIAGKVDAATVTTALWVTILIIALNIIATFAYHLTSPTHQERIEEQNLRATIEAAARRQISKNAEVLAEQLAPRMAADTVRRMQTKYLATLGTTPALPSPASARQVTAIPTSRKPRQKLTETVKSVGQMRLVENKSKREAAVQPIYNPQPPVEYVNSGREQARFPANHPYEVEPQEEEEEIEQEQDFLFQAEEVELLEQEEQAIPSIPVWHNGKQVGNPTNAREPQQPPYPPQA